MALNQNDLTKHIYNFYWLEVKAEKIAFCTQHSAKIPSDFNNSSTDYIYKY